MIKNTYEIFKERLSEWQEFDLHQDISEIENLHNNNFDAFTGIDECMINAICEVEFDSLNFFKNAINDIIKRKEEKIEKNIKIIKFLKLDKVLPSENITSEIICLKNKVYLNLRYTDNKFFGKVMSIRGAFKFFC